MADMFPGASALGESVNALFNGKQDTTAQLQSEVRQERANRTSAYSQNQGTDSMLSIRQGATANSPSYGLDKNKPAITEDPMDVEARWTARLAKYAGIAQATGVKMGSK